MRTFILHPEHFDFKYFVPTLAQAFAEVFQIPVKFGRTVSSCPMHISFLLRLRWAIGEHTLISSSIMVLVSIFNANCLRNASCGSGFPCLPRARAYTELTSATEQTKVNCRVSQHLVCQTCSSPIWSCLLLFTSSTQCLLWLCRERYTRRSWRIPTPHPSAGRSCVPPLLWTTRVRSWAWQQTCCPVRSGWKRGCHPCPGGMFL